MPDVLADAHLKPFSGYDQATAFLTEQAKRANVLHLSYWYLQFSDGTPDQVVWVSTYDPEYMNVYMKNFTPLGDPVIETVMDDRIVDWAEWLPSGGTQAEIYEIAKNYGITKYGLSMPLQVDGQDKIIFSVCVNSDDISWPKNRAALVQQFKPFARRFDERIRPLIVSRRKGEAVFQF